LIITGLWVVGIQTVWDLIQWGALVPKEVGLTSSMYIVHSESRRTQVLADGLAYFLPHFVAIEIIWLTTGTSVLYSVPIKHIPFDSHQPTSCALQLLGFDTFVGEI
jgi:hypothetical protein